VAAEIMGDTDNRNARAQKKEQKPVKQAQTPKKTEYKIKEPRPAGNVDHEYQAMVAAALRHQTVSDSLAELSMSARIKVRDSEDPNDRWLYQKQILVWEKKAGTEQLAADDLYVKIASYKPIAKSELPEAIEKEKEVGNITVYRFKESSEEGKADSTEKSSELAKKENTEEVKPEVKETTRVDEPVLKETGKALNRFVVLSESPYTNENPIPLDSELPKGSFYRIQIGAFSKSVAPDAFGGLSPITAETIPERGLTKYYVGKFSHYKDAVKAQSVVRSSGYDKAYIVSWYNGGTMTLEKVRKLEK